MTALRPFFVGRVFIAATALALCWFAGGTLLAQQRPQAAPVPEAVAIPRPTAEEVATAEASLAKLLESVDEETRAILDKFPGLIAVVPPRDNTAVIPALLPFFRNKHEANVEIAKQGDIDVLFMGDSITDFWRNTDGPFAGKAVFDKHFGEMKVANFGIAGDTTQGVLYRLQNGEGQGYSPKVVMLMIGTNNIGRNTGPEIAEGIGAVILQMRTDFPEARILLLGIFPRGAANDPARATIADINARIAKLDDGEHVTYLDIGEKFLDDAGNIPTDVMSDGLHPSAKGYEIWAEAVREHLARLGAQANAGGGGDSRVAPGEPVTFTTQEDHQNMLAQLSITRLRPGPSGNPEAPNPANYDESLANPFPNLPDALTLHNGTLVATAEEWWTQRRPEIVEDFEREVYGRVPDNVPDVAWEVRETREIAVAEVPVIEQHIVGTLDNSACPAIEVRISMSLALPKDASDPVPLLMMFGPTPFDPRPAGFGGGGPRAAGAGRSAGRRGFGPSGPSRTEALIKAGWGYAMISPGSIQADNGAGLTRGVIGLTNLGQPRQPDDWGALRAWAWGAARGLDYLEAVPAVDARRVGIEGVSRYGKAALVAMAFEPRFAMALVGSSGEGGAKLHRRNFGEAVENLTGSGEYHWMAGNFLKYGADESSFGSRNAGDIPVDAHQLIALCAPRPTFISYGVPEAGDAHWLDQRGSFMAAVAAGPVFRLLGATDLGTSDDYLSAGMPEVNVGLLAGALAWRQHDGGHTDGPNIPHFIAWAEKLLAERTVAN